MITVHHLENSRSQRILWLLEELGLDYEVKRYERNPETSLAPPELKLLHPLGKSPVITEDKLVVAETGAIIEYVLEKYGEGRLIPKPDSPERLHYTYWLHASEGTVMPLMVMSLIFNRIESGAPWLIRPIAKAISGQVKAGYLEPNIEANLRHMEAQLEKSTWFAGNELTAADIAMSFPVEAAATRTAMGMDYPHVRAFLDRIHSRPAYKAALEKGGPYALLT